MNLRFVLISSLSYTLLISCSATSDNPLDFSKPSNSSVAAIASPTATTPDEETSEHSQAIKNERGWNIPGLAESVSGEKHDSETISGAKLTITHYIPRHGLENDRLLRVDDLTDEQRIAVGIFQRRYGDLEVLSIWEYIIGGKKVCYLVTVAPQGIAAAKGLLFYDLDKDGKFETLKGGLSPDFTPKKGEPFAEKSEGVQKKTR